MIYFQKIKNKLLPVINKFHNTTDDTNTVQYETRIEKHKQYQFIPTQTTRI